MTRLLLLVLLINSETLFAQVNLTQGLVAHYPFNGNANDVSGNNNNPVFNNATLTSDRFNTPNSAYRFNGINSYIRIPNSASLNTANAVTLAVFIKPMGFNYGTCHGNSILMKGTDDTPSSAYRLRFADEMYSNSTNCSYSPPDTIHQNYWGPGTKVPGGYTPYVTKNEWISLIYTYDGTNAKLYVNCQLVANVVAPGYFFNNAQDLFIGKMDNIGYPYWLNGELDDIRIYNRAINEDEVKAIAGTCQVACNNWLKTTNPGDAVKIGDLDISGNQLTVEATFNRVAPYTGGYLYGGDLVSKHDQPTDCNYLLRSNNAEITTTNGFFQTPAVCEIELNKTYHVAMTYNGSSLRFYRNGFLLKEIPASGNLVQNNWITTIGDYAPGTTGTPENLNGYINEVRIWNVARSQADIRAYMNASLPNPATQTGLLAYYTFDNLNNKQGNTTWNGTLTGGASINSTNMSCTFSADSCMVPPCPQKNDFAFEQNTCNPYQITFSTTSTTFQNIKWDYGDSNSSSGSASVSHTYGLPGVYQVKMIQYYQNCTDTVTKTLTISIQNDNQTILTSDTTICIGSTKQLQASPALSYCWSPATHLSDPSIQNPVTSTPGSITYYLTTQKKGNNLVVNGDFAAGNTGFISDYQHVPASGFNPGVYTVANNPVAWHPQMPNCGDHTPGTNGNMMIVNGAEIANVRVWSQTIAVQPNTNYAFETWLQHMTSSNPAKLQFAINGVTIGPVFVANNTNCIWDRFYAVWNSGNSTSANISIVNQNQVYTGNDFALDDISFSPLTITRDSVKITTKDCTTPICAQGNDFSLERNPCAPFTIKYTASAVVHDSITWNLGDGTVLKNSASFSHTYLAPGNYSVSMIRYLGTCSDTVRKTINVSIQNDIQTILTNDTSICLGATKQLLSSPALRYCWSPSTFLSDHGIQNPVTSATQNITYHLTTESIGTNLIANGNFSAGNSGFTSQYSYTANNTTEGEYFVGPSPQAWYFAHFPCTDHTTGNGNMLLVNGSPTADIEVWKTTVTVTPNTNYAFSTWISSISNPNPAQLAFTINGIPVGNQINASVPPCNWKQFYSTWNSGNSTSATIAIVNKNTVAFGNDFALDDISFAPVFIKRDSVKIIVDTPSVNTNNDTTVCAGSQIQLTASGGVTYSWTPGSTLSNSTIANPIATPLSSTKYVVTGTTAAGCSAKDSITITVNPKPVISIINDTLICASTSVQLNASGGTVYSWSPASSLSSSTISNPVASPSANTTYFVTVTDANNCSNNDSVKVAIRPVNQFSINSDESVCLNDSIQLVATGGDLYNWGPVSGLSNTSVSNPMAAPETTTIYSVTITDTLCNVSETLSTTVSILPLPVLALSKSNDIDCSNNRSQLVVTGASQYLWAPANSLSNPNINNPFASPLQTTQYVVAGKDLNGCINIDSITVLVTGDNKGGYLMPNAFTPNNDGLNDCYGISGWGVITELDFSIYNRWGELVFHSTDPLKCWDGTYKGIKQAPTMYAYVVRAKTSCESSVFRKGMFSLIR